MEKKNKETDWQFVIKNLSMAFLISLGGAVIGSSLICKFWGTGC